MEKEPRVSFWRNPMSVLSFTLLLIIAVTGIMIYYLGDTLQRDHKDFSLLENKAEDLPMEDIIPAAPLPDTDQRIAYIDANFYAMPSKQLHDLINDILVMDPINREALLLAAKLADQEGRKSDLVAITRTIYRHYPEQAYLYNYCMALHNNNQSDQAYDVMQMGRDPGEYSPLLDILAAELAAVEGDHESAMHYWRAAGSPSVDPELYPFLAELFYEEGAETNE